MFPVPCGLGTSCDPDQEFLKMHSSFLFIDAARLLSTSFARAISKAKKEALLLFSVVVLLAGGAATVRGQSALDGFDPNANSAILVVVVQPDGKILIGGEFTTLSPNGGVAVTRSHIARLNPDGTLDTAFNPNANNPVLSIAVQADGKILAGGYFTSIEGQTRNAGARCSNRRSPDALLYTPVGALRLIPGLDCVGAVINSDQPIAFL